MITKTIAHEEHRVNGFQLSNQHSTFIGFRDLIVCSKPKRLQLYIRENHLDPISKQPI